MRINLLKDGFKLLWFIEMILYIAIPFGVMPVQRVCYYLFYIINFILFSYVVINISVNRIRLTRKSFKNFILIVLIIFSLLISCIINHSDFSFDIHFSAIMNYFGFIFSIFYVKFIDFDDDLKKYVLSINIIIAILFFILSISPYAYTHEKLTTSLNLGYSNPNATAIYIFLVIPIILSFFEFIRLRKARFILLLLIAYLIYLIYLTESRTCMLVSIILIMYFFSKIKIDVTKRWIVIGLFIPLLFLFAYSYMYEKGYFQDLIIMGKEFYSGREGYYVEVLLDIKKNLLFGNFGYYHLTNTHNGPLSILASLGLSGLLLLYIYLYSSLKQFLIYQTKISKMALFSILILFILSSSEAAIFVGGSNFTVPIATLFLISKAK